MAAISRYFSLSSILSLENHFLRYYASTHKRPRMANSSVKGLTSSLTGNGDSVNILIIFWENYGKTSNMLVEYSNLVLNELVIAKQSHSKET